MTEDEISKLIDKLIEWASQASQQSYEAGFKEGARIERLKRQGRPILPPKTRGRPIKGSSRKALLCESFGEGAAEAYEVGKAEICRREQQAQRRRKPKY
jgi:hypothetical protein